MKNESSLFSRAQYLEELADAAARPIGKETRLSVIVHFLQKEFYNLVNLKTGASCTERKSNAQLYEHKAYPELFYEVAEVEMGDKKNPHQVAVYDFINDKMLIATNYPSNVPEKPVRMNATIKSRLYEDYNLNAFPFLPFDTIDGLLNQVPATDHTADRATEDDPRYNDAQSTRTHWLQNYVQTMFSLKAHDFQADYTVPLFANKNILCKKDPFAAPRGRHWMEIQDINQSRILNVHSDHHPTMSSDGYREYHVDERMMTEKEITTAKNVLFLIEKNHLLRPNTVLNLDHIDLPNETLPGIIDVGAIPVIPPKNKL